MPAETCRLVRHSLVRTDNARGDRRGHGLRRRGTGDAEGCRAGGARLPYFGGLGNYYATHAIAQMMDEVRKAPGNKGLVTANGNYVTKQSPGIYATEPPTKRQKYPALHQREIDSQHGPPVAEVAKRGRHRGNLHGNAQPEGAILRHPFRTPR
jgi:hypothetical protein